MVIHVLWGSTESVYLCTKIVWDQCQITERQVFCNYTLLKWYMLMVSEDRLLAHFGGKHFFTNLVTLKIIVANKLTSGMTWCRVLVSTPISSSVNCAWMGSPLHEPLVSALMFQDVIILVLRHNLSYYMQSRFLIAWCFIRIAKFVIFWPICLKRHL